MLSRAADGRFWTANQTVSAIGAALCAHWAAAKAAAQDQFWGRSQTGQSQTSGAKSWLDMPRRYLNRVTPPR